MQGGWLDDPLASTQDVGSLNVGWEKVSLRSTVAPASRPAIKINAATVARASRVVAGDFLCRNLAPSFLP
jgi:hypothetical protein